MEKRIEMLRAMETVIRNMNDESAIDEWLRNGIPDGAINSATDSSELEWLAEKDNFADIMDTFCYIMREWTKGLDTPKDRKAFFYCDGVQSEQR